ncbi:50S ribosomal protein L18 [bacterium]|jgi:large subunit ribosomal protein L18|nr:50S ribosomal protein L18 [bacterium]NBX49377.1 50S ribosomal protein L18 [bacterium]
MTKKEIQAKRARSERRAARVRAVIRGTAERPRLSVFRSQKHISAQVIDDVAGRTLVSAQDLKLEKLSPLERAQQVGKLVAESAKKAGITTVVFDRGAYLFHGRVKALAEAAREAGLQF